jgi:RNA polymerase sigma-70 factor (ECF subfamily)
VTLEVRQDELRRQIREYTPRLLAVARGFATGDVEAEDILQEVWWKVARRGERRPSEVPLGAWLVAVTLNVGRDHLRRTRRRDLLMRLWGGVAGTTPPAQDPVHEGSALWRAVGELPALQREVVILRVVEGVSTSEAASILGRAEGTVKASLSRALSRLRRQFDREGRGVVEVAMPDPGGVPQ